MVENMIRLHFTYEDIYEQVKLNYSDISITFDELLDLISEIIIEQFKI